MPGAHIAVFGHTHSGYLTRELSQWQIAATAPSCAEVFRTIQAIKATSNAALQCINVQVQPRRIIIPYSRNVRVSTRQRLPGRASSRPLTALHKTDLKIIPHFRHHFTFAPTKSATNAAPKAFIK